MTLTVEAAIPDALMTHLQTLDWDTAQIAWPNIAFEPTAGTPYLEVQHLPNDTVTRGLSFQSHVEYRGFLQVSVMWPRGGSATPAHDASGKIIAHFAKGTRVSSNGVNVRIDRRPWAAPAMQEKDRVRIPVSIPYRVLHV